MKENETHRSAGKLINELSRAAHIFFGHEFRKYSIGHAQIRALMFIARHTQTTQKELTDYLNLDKSSVTSQMKILEKNGYVKRQASEKDSRMQLLTITKQTEDIIEPLKKVFFSWTEILTEGFEEKEKEVLFNYLERMRLNAKNKLENIKGEETNK